jgi:hypothetical protein
MNYIDQLSKTIFSIMLFISCNNEIIKTNTIINEFEPGVHLSSKDKNNKVSGHEHIYINVKNFSRIWKIYLSIINNSLISLEDRTLIDTISVNDQTTYQTIWDTEKYPNGEYELFVEIIDSLNDRITSTNVFYIDNFILLKIENKLELQLNYELDENKDIIFSNSVRYIRIKKLFEPLPISFKTINFPCGEELSYEFLVYNDSLHSQISILPDYNMFFLRIMNNSDNYIRLDGIQVNGNTINCNNIYLANNYIHSIGYFPYSNLDSVEILSFSEDVIDTNIISFYNDSIKIDTLYLF